MLLKDINIKFPIATLRKHTGTNQILRGYLKTGTTSLMRVLERISELVTVFIEANKNFICNFSKKEQPKIVIKPSALIQKSQI